jgi:hypothetical protein
MRRVLGCLLLLASVMTLFVVIAAALVARALDPSAALNVPLIVGVLVLAFAAYLAGMMLLTSMRR